MLMIDLGLVIMLIGIPICVISQSWGMLVFIVLLFYTSLLISIKSLHNISKTKDE